MQGTTQYTCAAGTHGWNTFTGVCDPADDNGHGTQVAGILGAVGNNSIGVAGVNWTTTIITAKMCNSTGTCYACNAIDAVQFMEGVKAYFSDNAPNTASIRVLNNSWGGPGGFSQALLDEIDNAYTADMPFVASAGNNGSDNDTTPYYPANYSAPNVVSVAAIDNRGYLASTAVGDPFSSNYGQNTVQLAAPGVYEYTTQSGSFYDAFNGTSAAAPFVTGTGALSLSVCAGDTDWLVPNILNNVKSDSSLSGLTVTGGVVNAYNSLSAGSSACPGTGGGMVQGAEQSVQVWQNGRLVTIYDTGSISLTVNGVTLSYPYNQYSSAYGLALLLSGEVNADSSYPVRAHVSGSTLLEFADMTLSAKTTGPATCYTVSTSYTYNTKYFHQPSFQIVPSGTTLVGCE